MKYSKNTTWNLLCVAFTTADTTPTRSENFPLVNYFLSFWMTPKKSLLFSKIDSNFDLWNIMGVHNFIFVELIAQRYQP